MWEPGPFPKASLKHVQGLEGNGACMDCGQPETSWGGPTYGILLCVKCAGRHRSLGTHLTVIKSLTMDRWDAGQVKRMELGGNRQLRAWFEKCRTENSAVEMKYRTKAATLYRENLKAAADEELEKRDGEERTRSSSRRKKGADKGRIFAAAEKAAAKDLAREKAQAEAQAAAQAAAAAAAAAARGQTKGTRRRRKVVTTQPAPDMAAASTLRGTREAHRPPGLLPGPAEASVVAGEEARRCGNEEYEVVFGPGGMGFTLMKDAVSRALVTRLAPGGSAFRLGVRTGDYLVGVDGRRLYDYDQLMLLLPHAPRPLRLLFEGAGAALAAPPPSAPSTAHASQSSRPRAGGVAKRAPGISSDSESGRSDSSDSESSTDSGSQNGSSSSGSSSTDDRSGRETGNGQEVRQQQQQERAGKTNTSAVSKADGTPPSNDVTNGIERGETRKLDGGTEKKGLNGSSTGTTREAAEQTELVEDEHEEDEHEGEPISGLSGPQNSRGEGAESDDVVPLPSATVKQGDEEEERHVVVNAGDGPTNAVQISTEATAPPGTSPKPAEATDSTAATAAATPLPTTTEGTTPEDEITAEAVEVEAEISKGDSNSATVRDSASTPEIDGNVSGRAVIALINTSGGSDVGGSLPAADSSGRNGEVSRGREMEGWSEKAEAEIRGGTKSSKRSKRKTKKNAKSAKDGTGVEGSAGKASTPAPSSWAVSMAPSSSYSSSSPPPPPSSSSRGHPAYEPRLSEGTKVSVRERKGIKWRKGLLRRKHGDGSWTVRYSGGMEERRVPADRMRLRGTEDITALVSSTSRPSDTAGPVSDLRGVCGARMKKEGRQRHRRSHTEEEETRNGDGDRGHRYHGGSKGGSGGLGGVPGTGEGRERTLLWTSGDVATGGRDEEFRVPGELHDDFFDSGNESSHSTGHALAAYAGFDLDPTATGNSSTGAVAPALALAPAYAASYSAPRYMEGIGGGGGAGNGSGWSGDRQGEARSKLSGAGTPSSSVPARGHTVSFPAGGMGLTLTKEPAGGCSVTKLVSGGVAQTHGVVLGQWVCAVNGQPSGTYEQTMAVIAGSPRPVTITFLDRVNGIGSGGAGNHYAGVGGGPPTAPRQSWAEVGLTATIGAMDAANAVAVEWGLGASTTGVLDEVQSAVSPPPPPQGFRVHQKHSLMAIPTGVAGGYGQSLARHRTFAVDVSPDMTTMSTKKSLSDAPGADEGEFDVDFGEGELGMRLEERGSFKASSVVVRVTEDGQAMSLGIQEGCTVVGINGEKYLSHAHTVATLKHAKRPVAVRFRAPDRR